jgi:hypothetical protein
MLEIFCLRYEPLRIMIDGELSAEVPGLDKSELDTATGICIGYSADIKHKSFTGSIRNLRYEECPLM